MKALPLNLYLASIALLAALSFTSCSNKITSLSNSKKMMTVQVPEKAKTTDTKGIASLPENTVKNQEVQISDPQVLPKKAPTAKVEHRNKPKGRLAQSVHGRMGQEVKRQMATVRKMVSETPAASYKGAQQTQGLLGAAILFLILGVILFVLGFHILGSLFWIIGVILLVAAVIFFILWLLAMAVKS